MQNKKFTGKDLKCNVQPEGARIKLIHKRSDMDDLPYMTDEEKNEIEDMLVKWVNSNAGVEASYGYKMLAHDPKLMQFFSMDFTMGAVALVREELPDFGDYITVNTPWSAMLYVAAKHHDCQWQIHSVLSIHSRIKGFDPQKFAMVDYPDHDTWNDEERLAIEFTKAVLDHKMTDELYKKAEKAWGVKGVMRIICWLGMFTSWCYLFNSFKITSPANAPYSGDDPSEWGFVDMYNQGKSMEESWGDAVTLSSQKENA
ncbi:MAG: hypothetical protein HKP58_11260 [Desulfatitalea sp.]|nr:hypothetical protein [Desulfatitalea sp.]NNK00980.1 hypothetical protein [Desulfatitalea sp.]